ncbi:MAG: chromate efflux transporter [Cyanobacteriota bacterium]|nr:chromate efflux transporter [Cyanobacteriota bacterium]
MDTLEPQDPLSQPAQGYSPPSGLSPAEQRQRLQELATVFFRLGCIAFGGPAAHIAMIDDEVVRRQQWMSREQLLDLIGVTNLLPGPNSTELAIHIGYQRAGWRGLLVAGSCFILPAMTLVWMLAALYARYQTVLQVGWLLYGIKPVIIAIILQALFKLGKKAIKDGPTIAVAIGVIVAYFLKVNEILLLLLAGGAVMLVKNLGRGGMAALWLPLSATLAPTGGPAVAMAGVGPSGVQVFLFFLKIGSVLYGSGYVLLAFLQRDLVERLGWLTSQELLDAIAIGQFTPGPVFTTATFVGYLVAGHVGAIAGTVGIFLPAFLLVGFVNPWIPTLRGSPWFGAFLDGVNAASLGLMAGVVFTLGQTALVDGVTLGLAILAAIAVFRLNINSAWIVLAGGLAGFVTQQLL